MREVPHREVAVGFSAGRDGEAAIADHRRGDAERQRRIDIRVPGDLRVVMRMAVDDAGREGEAAGIDGPPRGAEIGADGGDAAALDGEIADKGWSAGAVDDGGAADEKVMHLRSRRAAGGRGNLERQI